MRDEKPLPKGIIRSRETAPTPQEKREGRINVFVEGKFVVGVYEDVAVALGLRVGQAITPERLEEITNAETARRAREDAFLLLSYRARSEKEVADRLQKRGYEPQIVTETLTFLRDLGFLNDESFAQRWAESRGTTRGRRALAFELRQKGVAPETAAQALETTYGDDGERDAARLAAVKKVGERPVDQSREARTRLAAFLTRRGFGWDSIRPVLTEIYQGGVEESDTSDDED